MQDSPSTSGAATVIVPFAGVLSEAGRDALQGLHLPRLAALLPLCAAPASPDRAQAEPPALDGMEVRVCLGPDLDPSWTLSPPHEAALAAALGLRVADGQVPLAALRAARAGLPADRAWGRLTPAHWKLGTEQISMLDPAALGLDAGTSAALLDAVRPLFESEGFELHGVAPDCWLAAHPALEDLACASLDRVVGRNVDRWLGSDPRARSVRRLQNEVQMLLHTHPVNAEREERGELPVNSFWLDGCGQLPAGVPAASDPTRVRVDDRLRAPALAEDWFAWGRAFGCLDEELFAQILAQDRAGTHFELVLCGERHARVLRPGRAAWWRRLRSAWRPADPRALLGAL